MKIATFNWLQRNVRKGGLFDSPNKVFICSKYGSRHPKYRITFQIRGSTTFEEGIAMAVEKLHKQMPAIP